ncbi:hypothetical protein NXS08_03195 [Gleimia sp. 6138-11-ORH1]|uniref:hypothetical protein n=1 Tax=Gleimia sp. 6138-11-ORH1 TaxID=2973937 RepID=UPI002169AAAA|nr:hypothetical protein [Gleimia sp. 6138-11-ORH1]MCS4484494.1 hypothetical protein [Gleimia sp. 6138-11-ORH1]
MPEAYRLLGYIQMCLEEYPQARESYFNAMQLGDKDTPLDMLRAAHYAGATEWNLDFSSSIDVSSFDKDELAEIELIQAHARCKFDQSLDIAAILHDLLVRFPDNELVAEAIRINCL